ncbi:GDSL esterase/lipase At5g45670-like [Salvia miltiorrhiza]|uniref:GDSL esterase/lipase At5g45670-like n=1 Tax=Salvia miltiorrhiza TaxID=226208 RepID=UPI0025AB85C7|nr:GDSL esterase/lipase At5g45670-like [Salvia miltiorrhiza]
MTKTNELKKWMVMSLVAAAAILHNAAVAAAEPQAPCLFIFGDSLIDPGNNNGMETLARVDFRPYGIDFPLGATGRFSNGKTVADFIAELLGFEDYIPSYLTARGDQILKGVNYASAAAGIRAETGRHWGNRTSFDGQLQNFNNTVQQITGLLGSRRAASDHLRKCVYISAIGNNEFINNYFLTLFYNTSKVYTIEEYMRLVLKQYSEQLEVLYTLGARKIAIIGTAPLGCIPINVVLNSYDGNSCVESNNLASQLYNKKLQAKIDVFNAMFPDAQFTYIDGYNPMSDVYHNAEAYGFIVKTRACCGSSVICLPNDGICINRRQYLYWDFAHPSEAACLLVARRAYQSQKPTDAYPYDLRSLALL